MQLKKPLKVILEGRGDLTLRPADHVATGGEGSVYRPSPATIVKLYTDQNKMQADGMPEKIHLLSKIVHQYIVGPKGLVFENQKPIGYYMNYEEGEPFARIFTNAYRQRENFGDKDALILVDGMKAAIEAAHAHKATLVDANEFNWIASRNKKNPEPRVIDVDSWAIDKWKASVIMPSIRDWHTQGFNEKSDWFSHAIVSFQVLTGIHPYKGGLDGYKSSDMELRMKENKSVFSPGVRLNNAVRDFNCIPGPLLAWYESVFQNKERCAPPLSSDVSIKAPRAAMTKRAVVTRASDLLVYDLLLDGISDTPAQIFSCGIIRMSSGKLIELGAKKELFKTVAQTCEVIKTDFGYLVAEKTQNQLTFSLVSNAGHATPLQTVLTGTHLLRYQNRMFVIGDHGMTEVSVKVFTKPILVNLTSWPVMLNSTKWFDGVGVQDSLGTTYLIAPFGFNSSNYVHTPELDGKKVVNAIAGTRYVVVTALDNKTGDYQKYEFVFDIQYSSYKLTITDIATADLNIALLPKGVTASIFDDGEIIITVPVNGSVKIVSDKSIESSFALANWENRVVYVHDNKVWSLVMK